MRHLVTPAILALCTSGVLAAADSHSTWLAEVTGHQADGTTTHKRVEREARRGDGEVVVDATITTEREGKVVTENRHHEVEVEREGRTTTWDRESTRADSEGRSRSVTAHGVAERDGEGGGTVEIVRYGERANREGETKTWETHLDGQWEKNDLGGKDSAHTAVRTNGDGSTLTVEGQKRTRTQGKGTAYAEAKVITTDDGREFVLREEGREARRYTKDGYVDQGVTRGVNKEGHNWQREEKLQVRYRDDGTKAVQRIIATRTRAEPAVFEVHEGVFTPASEGQGWDYAGNVVIKRKGKVVETRDVTRRFRRLPIPASRPLDPDA